MNHIQPKTVIENIKCLYYSILAILIFFMACTFPGSKQETSRIRLTVQNTLPVERKNVPIILTIDQLRNVNPDFSLKAFSVVTGKAPREAMIPAQADDLNYDGERDQLVFLLNLEKEETKEISILYDPNVKATFTLDVKKQTRAGIFPELNVVAAMESDLIAYLLQPNGAITAYGKRRQHLFSVDKMYQGELDYGNQISQEFRLFFDSHNISLTQNPQALNIEVQQPEQRWVIHDFENQQDYYIRKSEEQLDFYESIGLSLNALLDPENTIMTALTPEDGLFGSGGFALWHKDRTELIPLPNEEDYVRILADGSMRSIVQRIFPKLNIYGQTLQLTSTTMIYGGHPWIEHHIHIESDSPSKFAIVTGIPKLSDTSANDEANGFLWSWGSNSAETHLLGVALIYPQPQVGAEVNIDPRYMSIILNPDDDGRVSYRALSIWGGGINGLENQIEFKQHLQIMTTGMENPLKINFIRGVEEEK